MVLLLLACAAAGAQSPAAPTALTERSELLPADLSMDVFTETPLQQGAVGDAHLFATPFYGPHVYLLALRLDFEESAPQVRSNRVSSPLKLRPAEQRIWAALVKLPDGAWPAEGGPELLSPLLESLALGCNETASVLAPMEDMAFVDASDGTVSITAHLAPWRRQAEPVLMIGMGTQTGGSGGGTHLTQAWYLSNASYQLQPLACAPMNAGFWTKPSRDMEGNYVEEGSDVSVAWTLQPGNPLVDDPTPRLELHESRGAGKQATVVARYRWGYSRYELQSADR